jgi:hypothetical protein
VRTCSECGSKLGFFETGKICKSCAAQQRAALAEKQSQEAAARELALATHRAQFAAIEAKLLAGNSSTDDEVSFLKSCPKEDIISLYGRLLHNFEQDDAFNEKEVQVLNGIQQTFSLKNEEIEWEAKVAPYYYAFMIAEQHKLPEVKVNIKDGAPIILKDGEVVHFFHNSGVLVTEPKTVSLGYSGSSQGISFPIPGLKGVRYRVGSHRGQVMKVEQQVTVAGGFLAITNQRLLIYALGEYGPLSVPLKKILQYRAFEDGIQIYTEGRQKPYSLRFGSHSGVELTGLCLSFLLSPPQ